jgi:Rhodopirellula transposase DDE domain
VTFWWKGGRCYVELVAVAGIDEDAIAQWWSFMIGRAGAGRPALVDRDPRDRRDPTTPMQHYPPGTSKRNRIEHKLFSQISINWRGRPLTSYETIISLIAATTGTTGLKVLLPPGPRDIRDGHQDHQPANGRREPAPPRVPWRLELHNQTDTTRRLIES